MDDKKFQKAIDILLQQQATTHADLEETKEQQAEFNKRVGVLERVSLNLYNTTVEQGKNIDKQGKSIELISADIRELGEAQKETNERLDAVIFMAEKYFSGENGKSKKK